MIDAIGFYFTIVCLIALGGVIFDILGRK